MKRNITKCICSLAASLAFCAFASSAFAQDPLRYEVQSNHPEDAPAQLRIIANESISDIDVTITNCAPQVVQRHIASMKKGESQTISWNQHPGRFSCGISINGKLGMGSAVSVRTTHTFVCGASSPLTLNVDLNELKQLIPTTNHVVLHASRPFNKASIVVSAEDGSEIDRVEKKVGAMTDYTLSWTPNGKNPVLLEIKVSDESGTTWASNTIMSFVIPHTDVVFDTNKYNIRADQEEHLKEPLENILDKVKRFDRVAVNLYITGHTDTVGSDAANLKLSMNRAKSIASYFHKHGLNIPTFYRGVGERDLAVKTEDNVDNEANRRAVYILSNVAPEDGFGGWNKL